jgi:hypothetical protein
MFVQTHCKKQIKAEISKMESICCWAFVIWMPYRRRKGRLFQQRDVGRIPIIYAIIGDKKNDGLLKMGIQRVHSVKQSTWSRADWKVNS